ncbi:CDP-alcohol phosphatidyltransferase family protein [Paracoccus sp. 1_MG-2023]|uniref:CDP-alcohol phosphatidyltransferase family protein n=1 Tax=unclassified Paracoccus (in: a-proteobacteria) TaxID=2688777 RepID=UPI001C08D774|nr:MULTISPECIES: CDP-alcohol phosphatidyltransferase family protein [unclassified Paracoccus (in: a-proteobacteria)]MBU2956561.1 CDP-alcohol phosphatidyltransferase family protein [Paracoccus sp. C2R09]MDO6668667.1 CDP-alcohol phosphatidyltransferase family protein [Paracoccus sp. 1_MG-2023]
MPIFAVPIISYLRRPALMHVGDGRLPKGLPVALIAGLVLTATVGTFLGTAAAASVGMAIFALTGAGIAQLMRWHYPHRVFGGCNAVTLMRTALTVALIVPLIAGNPAGWWVASVAGIALIMDGIDGWLARRSGLSSEFGARFDMEVDAALALVLSLHALVGSPIGPEVLLLGVMRYLFVLAGICHHAFRQPLPPSFLRKAICVMQLGALILLQLPMVSPDAGIIIGRIAAGALIWSFGTDAIWLWRHR